MVAQQYHVMLILAAACEATTMQCFLVIAIDDVLQYMNC